MQTVDVSSVLAKLITNKNKTSVLDLSQSHRVSLTFIKWLGLYTKTCNRLGCPMCVHDIQEIANILPTFLYVHGVVVPC